MRSRKVAPPQAFSLTQGLQRRSRRCRSLQEHRIEIPSPPPTLLLASKKGLSKGGEKEGRDNVFSVSQTPSSARVKVSARAFMPFAFFVFLESSSSSSSSAPLWGLGAKVEVAVLRGR